MAIRVHRRKSLTIAPGRGSGNTAWISFAYRWQRPRNSPGRNAHCARNRPESFFPEKGGSTREAKRICSTCEVRRECLEFALENDERFGIWGGLSERERRRLKSAPPADPRPPSTSPLPFPRP